MLKQDCNIRIINPETILLMLIVFIVFLIFNSSYSDSPENKKNRVSSEKSITIKNAEILPVIRLQIFHKSRQTKIFGFNIMPYRMLRFVENKTTCQKVILLKKKWDNYGHFPLHRFSSLFIPDRKDEPPVLSLS